MIENVGVSLGELVNCVVAGLERASEIEELYWNSDIPTTEIAEAYGIAHARLLCERVRPAIVEGIECRHCQQPITVRSRAELKKKLAALEWSRRQGSDRWRVAWAHPDVCKNCSDDLQARDQAQLAAEISARALRGEALRTMPYREYLQTSEWREKRTAALKRAGYRCQTCCSGGQLNVHHRTYARRGSEWARDLIVLCQPCHAIFHEAQRLAEGGRGDS